MSSLIKPSLRDPVHPPNKVRVVAEALRAERGAGAIAQLPRRHWVSLNAILDWYRAVARRTAERWFAYRAGQRFHVSSYGLYGFAILSSTDFRQTVRFALQYHELATPLTGVTFVEHQGDAIWQIGPISAPQIDSALYRFLVELQFGIHTALHRDVMGPKFAARELRVTYPPQTDPQTYQEEFGCQVRFRAPRNEFVFDAAWLNRPAELGDSAAFAELLQLCDQRLATLRMRTGVSGQVRALLLSDLQRVPTFGSVAARLRMSERTLRRTLKQENHNFRSVLDELRRMLAVQYVRDTSMSIEDVAAAVGFADSASFRKAFRRWTGTRPAQFRRSF